MGAPRLHGFGIGYNDVLPYFLKSEDMKIESLKDSKYQNTGGYLGVSQCGVTHMRDKYLQAGKEIGYDVTDYNGETQIGFSDAQITVRDGVRSSTSLEFLGLAKSRQNLHVAVHRFVTKVQIEDNTATGVDVIHNLRKYFLKANKEVILTAGAIRCWTQNTP